MWKQSRIKLTCVSLNFCEVFDQTELEISDLDHNQVKTRPSLLKTFKISIYVDSHIVYWYIITDDQDTDDFEKMKAKKNLIDIKS